MKKITFFLFVAIATLSANAQITYNTVFTDDFETANQDFVIGSTTFKTGGIPANMSIYKQSIWSTYSATNNPYPYTGTLWKDVYSSNSTAANKTYRVSAVPEERTGGTGTQCLRFDMTGSAFGSYATPFVVRWRANDGVISFNTAAGEGLTKYEVTFWARVDGADKAVLVNALNPNSYLTLTSTWQKYTIARYTTGLTSTALGIDFYPISDNSDYSVYIDDMTIKERKIAYTSAASNITVNSFTANWVAVAGANSYSVIVEKTDGAATPTWTPVAGSPFVAGNVQTLAITNLDAGTYRYRVTATDGTTTTVESNNTSVTLAASGVKTVSIKALSLKEGKLYVSADLNGNIELYNTIGQCLQKQTSNGQMNIIQLNKKGVYLIKVNNDTRKIIY